MGEKQYKMGSQNSNASCIPELFSSGTTHTLIGWLSSSDPAAECCKAVFEMMHFSISYGMETVCGTKNNLRPKR